MKRFSYNLAVGCSIFLVVASCGEKGKEENSASEKLDPVRQDKLICAFRHKNKAINHSPRFVELPPIFSPHDGLPQEQIMSSIGLPDEVKEKVSDAIQSTFQEAKEIQAEGCGKKTVGLEEVVMVPGIKAQDVSVLIDAFEASLPDDIPPDTVELLSAMLNAQTLKEFGEDFHVSLVDFNLESSFDRFPPEDGSLNLKLRIARSRDRQPRATLYDRVQPHGSRFDFLGPDFIIKERPDR